MYNPYTFEKLNLDICNDIDVVIPIELDQEIIDLYKLLKDQGYDLFNINNKFYFDICTPFTAENGADVLLDDRLLYFYSKIVDIITCPKNCKYSQFSLESLSLSCSCQTNSEDIDVDNVDKLKGFSDYSPSLEGYKYTSYKTMKCYKLVFSGKYFIKNAGSIVVLIIIIAYIVFMVFFFIKDISPLKIYLSKYLFGEDDKKFEYEKINTLSPFIAYSEKSNKSKKKKMESKSVKSSKKEPINIYKSSKNEKLFPPKKSRANKSRVSSGEGRKDTEHLKLIDIINKKKKFGKMQKFHNIRNKKNIGDIKKKIDFDVESLKSDKVRTRKSIIDLEKAKEIRMKKEKEKEREKILNVLSDYKLRKFNEDELREKKTDIKKPLKIRETEKEEILLDDYELNHLEYEMAGKKDKRSFWQMYWSILKRDQLILFTFVSRNDFNLFYVKIAKFLFTILTLMTMNAFLYADKSIHKLYLNGVKYDFGQQALQIFLSIVITHVMEILLCFLTLTDRYIYEIKILPRKEINKVGMFDILQKIRIKLFIFFIAFFVISLFYWYFISAFCAVYHNTQGLYILDCVLSFIFFSIDPFIIYAIVAYLRFLSLTRFKHKKVKCLYTTSRLFPIF